MTWKRGHLSPNEKRVTVGYLVANSTDTDVLVKSRPWSTDNGARWLPASTVVPAGGSSMLVVNGDRYICSDDGSAGPHSRDLVVYESPGHSPQPVIYAGGGPGSAIYDICANLGAPPEGQGPTTLSTG
jgi:hypothetical protein